MTHPADHNGPALALHLANEGATEALGAALARQLRPGMRVYLSGELGSGKTTLVRAVLRALGYPGRVKSPTYTLLEPYEISSLYLYHFDFYRLERAEEFEESGFREALSSAAACLVEWPERAARSLPPPDLHCHLSLEAAGRAMLIEAGSETGARCITALRSRGGFS